MCCYLNCVVITKSVTDLWGFCVCVGGGSAQRICTILVQAVFLFWLLYYYLQEREKKEVGERIITLTILYAGLQQHNVT